LARTRVYVVAESNQAVELDVEPREQTVAPVVKSSQGAKSMVATEVAIYYYHVLRWLSAVNMEYTYSTRRTW
jgi:hypothetical protein